MSTQQLPPAQPAYILRGHTAQVHGLHFTQSNRRLLTGDADGWIVSWSLAHKRPVATWKGHDAAILGLASWGRDRVITHGRDNRLIVWKLSSEDENNMEITLPVDNDGSAPKQPWILHILDVNTLNFCSFAMCYEQLSTTTSQELTLANSGKFSPRPILIGVPNAMDSGGVDIFQIPSEMRISVIGAEKSINTGMVMALSLQAKKDQLKVITGYESGHTMVFTQKSPQSEWQKIYSAQPHSQPVLALATSLSQEYYITSSADAIIAKHPLGSPGGTLISDSRPIKIVSTKHSGQQGLRIRSDGRIFATAGWDARIRVYSTKTMKELAVLKWHKDGCYATAFADITDPDIDGESVGESTTPEGTVEMAVVRQVSTMTVAKERRDQRARWTHWLAAGSKDGKVSLWDIY